MFQFSGRNVSGLTHTGLNGNDQGWCCGNTGGLTYFASTRYECLLKQGFFTISSTPETACPKVNRGKCCGYNSSNNLLGSTSGTPCDCTVARLKTEVNSNITGFTFTTNTTCPTSDKTADFASQLIFDSSSGACCYWGFTGGKYVNQCQSSESMLDCETLHQGAAEGLKYAFYEGAKCEADGGEITCNGGAPVTQDTLAANPNCIPDTNKDCFKAQRLLGNCCSPLPNGLRVCSITTEDECQGYWNYLGYVSPCLTGSLCSGVYFPGLCGAQGYLPATASLTTITTSTNPLETLPSTPAMYQGGLYVGVFEPGSPINVRGSTVRGNIATGDWKPYSARGTGPGTNNKKWILIAAPSDILLNDGPILNVEKDTSHYDGFYSTRQNVIEFHRQISEANFNGFRDWYVPSQDELAFYFNTISSNFTKDGFTPLSSSYYLTSTYFGVGSNNKLESIGDKYFAYAQSARTEDYGKVVLMAQGNMTCKVRLFRRIYLGS